MALRIALVLVVTLAADTGTVGAEQASVINVRGHWQIDVRSPGGELVSHSEFENAFRPEGARPIAGMLTAAETLRSWAVVFTGGGCVIQGTTTGHCASVQPSGSDIPAALDAAGATGLSDQSRFLTLEVKEIQGVIRLSGSITITSPYSDLQIFGVGTNLWTSVRSAVVTWHDLETRIPVRTGQIVQFTVDISFGPAS